MILHVFRICRVYTGSIFFSLVLILRIPAYLVIKGDQFFSDFRIFLAHVLHTNWCTTICITRLFLCKIVQIDLIQFVYLNCIRSICTKLGFPFMKYYTEADHESAVEWLYLGGQYDFSATILCSNDTSVDMWNAVAHGMNSSVEHTLRWMTQKVT